MLRRLPKIEAASRGRRLVLQTAGNAGLNGALLVFNFAIALILSRLLGPDGYGAYAFAVAVAMFLAVPTSLGLAPLVIRETAIYRVRRDWGRARGLLRRTNQAVLIASLAICLAAAAVFFALDWPEPPLFEPTLIGLALVPVLALVTLRQSAMQGFGAAVLAKVPEALVAPVLMIVLIFALNGWLPGGLSASSAVTAQVIGAAFAALVGVQLLRRTVPRQVREAEPLDERRAWLLGALPILLASGIQALNVQVGTILSGSIAGSEEAGIYNVAARVAQLLSFLLIAALPSVMPTVAQLYAQRDAEALQRVLTRGARLVLLGSLPLAAGMIVFAEPILGLFGTDFEGGATALRIMCAGQLVSVVMGFTGTTMQMIGDAGLATWVTAAATTVNVLLSAALIPGLGVEGAAVGTAASVALTNVWMAHLLWRNRTIYSPGIRLWRAPASRASHRA